jgi:FixJ family two-component response regulator
LGSALDPKVVSNLIEPVNGGRLDRLSERERDVLDLMTQGLTKVAIATRLTLVGTVADGAHRRLTSTWQRSTIAVLQLDTASFTG